MAQTPEANAYFIPRQHRLERRSQSVGKRTTAPYSAAPGQRGAPGRLIRAREGAVRHQLVFPVSTWPAVNYFPGRRKSS